MTRGDFMCTSIAMRCADFRFGRNLDLDRDFGDGAVLTPRNYPIKLRCGDILRRHHAFIGMASVVNGYALYADGMNEAGLYIAALEFTDNAYYPTFAQRNGLTIAPFELIPYVLSRMGSIDEVASIIKEIDVVNTPFSDEIDNSDLHFHVSDNNESIVIEFTRDGTNVYKNANDVLANNPPFPFHRDNMRLYSNLESGATAADYCNGLLAHGLPGDYSSPSRFIKAAWLNKNSACEAGGEDEELFAILYALAPPMGAVINTSGNMHYTRYTAVMGGGRYSWRPHGEKSILCVDIKKESLDGEALVLFGMRDAQPKIL